MGKVNNFAAQGVLRTTSSLSFSQYLLNRLRALRAGTFARRQVAGAVDGAVQ